MPASRFLLNGVLPLLFLAAPRAQNPLSIRSDPMGEIATLYASDPLGWSMSLHDGGPGLVIQQNDVANRDSTITFETYGTGEFTLGEQGDETAAIVDLGLLNDLGRSLGIAEAPGNGRAWAAITMQQGQLGLVKDGKFEAWTPAKLSLPWDLLGRSQHAVIRTGHVYMLHTAKGAAGPCVVKLVVLRHEPGVSVTFRWQRLDG